MCEEEDMTIQEKWKRTEEIPTGIYLILGGIFIVMRFLWGLFFQLDIKPGMNIMQGLSRIYAIGLIALYCYDRYRLRRIIRNLMEEKLRIVQETDKKEKTMEENVRRRYDDITWMKSMMTHNIRMPLAIIDGYGQLLKKDMIHDKKQRMECIDKICGNINYLNHIISLVLDGEQSPIQYDFREIDLIGCIREVCTYVESATRRANIRIVLNTRLETLKVEADYIQIMRIFYNMFENSFKYLSPLGSIVITVDRINETEVLLIYKDNGSGMEKKETEHIFEEHYQGSNSKNGSGMGMSFVKEVVESHNGKIEVQSDIGKGMGIYIHLPVKHQTLENL